MKKMSVLFVAIVLLSGCGVNQAFVNSVDDSWSTIGPEYRAYVNADAELDAGGKQLKIDTADMLDATILEAKK